MENNRRRFLQQAGLLASVSGMAMVNPLAAAAEDVALVSEKVSLQSAADSAIGKTTYGNIKGYIRNGTFTFKGIPYGADTAGNNRFMPPVKPKPWVGTKDCLVYGPICPQRPDSGWLQQEYGFLYQWIDGFQDEDCLRLNIWSPSINDNKKRPVLFWIHGGGFFSGSSQEHPSYDGENLSKLGDVVVVSINHRLNIFGYLDLSAHGPLYASSGNVGMLDIVAALEWVRDNIGNFGGDAGNVTIFGQSGGGAKVTTLMAMPAAKGLFHKAVSQSNSIVQVSTPEYARQITAHVLSNLGIDSEHIADLQHVKPARLVEAIDAAERMMGSAVPAGVGRSGLQPVVDGVILPTHPFDPVAPAISATIPFMVGTTRNEASASINNPPLENLDEAGLQKRLGDKYGVKGELIYKTLRRVHPEMKPVELLSLISAQNPMAFLMASRKAEQNKAAVYLYMFAWHTPQLDGRPRAFHCSEIPFAFANTDRCENYTGASKEARKLGNRVAKAWINFARYGNPNHSGLPAWPEFKDSNGAMMVFNEQCKVLNDPDGDARVLLQRLFYSKDV